MKLKKLLNLDINVHSFLSQLLDFDKSSFFQKLQASFISSFLFLTLKIHTYRIFVWHHEIVLNSKHDIFDNTDLDLLHSSSTFFLVEEKKAAFMPSHIMTTNSYGSKFVYFFYWCSNDMVDKEASSACCLHEHLDDMSLCVLDFATDLFASSYFVSLTNITSILLLWYLLFC